MSVKKMVVMIGCVLGVTTTAAPAFAQHRGAHAIPYRGYGVYHGGYPGYRVAAPVHYIYPYYVFHPHVSVGFGIWAGYPVAYSYGFYDPFFYANAYPYPVASPYPYPPAAYPPPAYPPPSGSPSAGPSAPDESTSPPASQGTVGVRPGQENMGGLSFDITPSTAKVLIDGRPAGTVGQFTPTTEPLGLPAGSHHVDIRARGYRTLTFDVDIVAGEVLPYQGRLER
jgi:hypothetical protein